MRRILLALVFLWASALLPTPVSQAQDLGVQVTPVIVALPPEQPITSVRIANRRAREGAFEASVYVWSQHDGEDRLTETADVIVAPSTFIVAPQGQQIIRIALAHPPRDLEREQTYRLIVRELPPPRAEPGLRLQLQLSMPVFVSPRDPATRLRALRAPNGAVLRNDGDAHVRLRAVTALPGGQPIQGAPRYLLAGAEVTLAAPANADALLISSAASSSDAPNHESLSLETAGDPPR